jgi:hypothetical protein
MGERFKWWDDGNKWRRWWQKCTRAGSERDLDCEPQVQVRCRRKSVNTNGCSRVQVLSAMCRARRAGCKCRVQVPGAVGQMPIANGQELSGECQGLSARAVAVC